MNPYEAPEIPARVAKQPFRLWGVAGVSFVLACVFFAMLAAYQLGYAHGYDDGNSDRVGKYPINAKKSTSPQSH